MKKIYLLKTEDGRYCSRRFSNREAAQECANYFNRPHKEYTVVSKNIYWVTICDEYYYLTFLVDDVWDYFKDMIEAMKDCFWTLFVCIFRIVFFPFILVYRYKKDIKKQLDKDDYKI